MLYADIIKTVNIIIICPVAFFKQKKTPNLKSGPVSVNYQSIDFIVGK